MNTKYIIVTVVLIVLALVVTNIDSFKKSKTDNQIGQTLLDEKEITALESVTISKEGSDTITLTKQENSQWVLSSDQNFPADASKVLTVAKTLSEAKFQRVVTQKEEEFHKFGLDNPKTLELKLGKSTKKFLIGNSRQGGGQYLAVGAARKGYLVSKEIRAAADTDSWEYKKILDIDKDEIKSITFKTANITLTREKKEDTLQAKGLKKDDKEKPSNASLSTLFSNISFTKRYDKSNEEAKTALLTPAVVSVELFDGTSYTIKIGKIAETKRFLTAEITAPTNSGAILNNSMFSNWYFEISTHVADRLIKSRADLLEAKKIAKKSKE